jgi:cytochrome c-type biogenesis protein CcmE
VTTPQNPPATVGEPFDDDEDRGLPAALKASIVVLVLGGAVALLLFGSEAGDAFVYSKLVHEVIDDEESFRGRELRVEGDLKTGSIKFKEHPCEWRFVIEKEGREMPVRFPQCIVPDTFKDSPGLQVTVQGKLTDEGHFLANQLIPRCPSKYEMQQRLENGEKMPHAPTAEQPAI